MPKLIVYNIEYCEGMRGYWLEYLKFWRTFFLPKNNDLNIINSIKKYNPDILSLVEADTGSIRSRKKDEVLTFKEKLNLTNYVEKTKYPKSGFFKFFNYIPILKKQANAILSKYKLSNIEFLNLSYGTKRIVIKSDIYIPHKVTLLLVHLALGKNTRKKQINELIEIVNNIKNPVILMGDFNTFKGEIEIKNLLENTNLTHKHNIKNKFTQPTYKPTRILDYILTSKDINVLNYDVLKIEYSDHLPILIEFEI